MSRVDPLRSIPGSYPLPFVIAPIGPERRPWGRGGCLPLVPPTLDRVQPLTPPQGLQFYTRVPSRIHARPTAPLPVRVAQCPELNILCPKSSSDRRRLLTTKRVRRGLRGLRLRPHAGVRRQGSSHLARGAHRGGDGPSRCWDRPTRGSGESAYRLPDPASAARRLRERTNRLPQTRHSVGSDRTILPNALCPERLSSGVEGRRVDAREHARGAGGRLLRSLQKGLGHVSGSSATRP